MAHVKKIGVAGFRGYSGADLVSLLEHHPGVEVFLMEHRADAADRPAARSAKRYPRIPCTADAVRAEALDCVLMATPHEVSLELAPHFLDAGAKVIDLSAAYRLTPADFKRWYKEEHPQPGLLAEAAYGLPEFYRERIKPARLVANPGCYPTAANLALRPLVRANLIDRSAGVICDAKSGVSGAGRKPSLKSSFCEVTENFSAYALLDHRHVPEVLRNSGLADDEFHFTAQLLPLHRGILETIYFKLTEDRSAADLVKLYEEAYAGEPFVRLYDPGQVPDLAAVARTNFCDIGVAVQGRRAVVVSAEDNLVKGAAGQAVQNLNLILGFAETEALL